MITYSSDFFVARSLGISTALINITIVYLFINAISVSINKIRCCVLVIWISATKCHTISVKGSPFLFINICDRINSFNIITSCGR